MPFAKVLSSDRMGGLLWFVFGAAVVYGSWTMDRLESLGIQPLTAPGLLPGLLGLGFMAFGLILLLRARQPSAEAAADAEAAAVTAAPHNAGFQWRRVLLSWGLCIAYAGALLGRGLPYWLLTGSFLFLHLILLDETSHVPARPTLVRFAAAAVIAPAMTIAVMLVFQRVFLVRLP